MTSLNQTLQADQSRVKAERDLLRVVAAEQAKQLVAADEKIVALRGALDDLYYSLVTFKESFRKRSYFKVDC